MNEKYNELLTYMIDTLQRSEAFVLDQAPDVFREMVLMGRVKFILILLAFLGLLFIHYKLITLIKEAWGDKAEEGVILGLLFIELLLSIPTIRLMVSINLKPFIAPKLYIIEQLGKIVGGC